MRNFIASLCLALLVAGCSTLGINTGPNSRALDPLHDDVASLLLVFDLPRGVGPAPGSLFTFDVANGGVTEHLRLQLAQADVENVGGNLPPPDSGRAYYLFGFSDADKASVRAAQASAQGRNVSSSSVTIGIVPHLCTSGGIDPRLVTVSISARLPGQTQLMRFIDHQALAELLTQPGSTQMPMCT